MPGLTLGWLFGIWLFQQQATLWSPVAFVALVLLGLAYAVLVYQRRSRKRLPVRAQHRLQKLFWMFAIATLGFLYAQGRAALRMHDALPAHCQQQVLRLQAVIVSVPERTPYGQSVDVAVEHVYGHACHVPTRLRLTLYAQQYRQAKMTDGSSLHPPGQAPVSAINSLPAQPLLNAGERWQFAVKLKQPHATRNPHGFDFAAWCLANRIGAVGGIVSKAPMRRLQTLVWQPAPLIARWRQLVAERISRVVGNTPESAVLRALVTGDDSLIDRTHWQLFVDTGINHLMSISGLHITMLAAVGYWCCIQLWRWRPRLALRCPSRQAATMAGALVALVYAALAGFSIPTQRTLYMLLTVAVLFNLKRQVPFAWMLSLALWVVLLLDPWAVLAAGFWLSFAAVAVLAFAMGGRLQPASAWRAALHSQWVVTFAFVPLLCVLFNQVSLVSPLANALAIPLISLAVVPLAIAGAIMPVDGVISHGLLKLAAGFTHLCLSGLQWLQHWSWAVWYQATPPGWAAILAVLGAGVLLLPRGWPMRWAAVLLWLPLLLPATAPLQHGQMRVTVLDIGQGLSVLVQTARHTLLYDAGPAMGSDHDAGQRIVLPYLRHLGIRQLTMAVVSHDDSDHVGGMASVLQAIPVGQVLSSLSPQATFFAQMQDRPIKHVPCRRGQHWQWDGILFQMLAPEDPADPNSKDNDKSCVLKITTAHGSLLLTGDIERIAEARLLQSGQDLHSTVMTIPHHGSKTSSSPAFVSAVSPDWAIATVGYLNRFGHPKAEIVQRYQGQGSTVLRCDQHGAVILHFVQGNAPQVQTWRQQAPHYWEATATP